MDKMTKFLKQIFLYEIGQGMWVTLKTMLTIQSSSSLSRWWPLRKEQYADTRQYPTFKRKAIPGSRGLHAMRRDEAGKPACIGCGLCEAVCPSHAIRVVTSESPEHLKLVNTYELDLLRCVFCGFCIDACPVSAILQTPEFELASYSRRDSLYTKDRLVEVGDNFMGRKAGDK